MKSTERSELNHLVEFTFPIFCVCVCCFMFAGKFVRTCVGVFVWINSSDEMTRTRKKRTPQNSYDRI